MFLITRQTIKNFLLQYPLMCSYFLEENTKQIYLNVRQSSKIVNNYTCRYLFASVEIRQEQITTFIEEDNSN
jgi:hypothetical protein